MRVVLFVLAAAVASVSPAWAQAGGARPAAPDTVKKPVTYVAGALSVPNADPFPSTYRPRESRPTIITNVTILTGTGARIDRGFVVLMNGKNLKQVSGRTMLSLEDFKLVPGDVHHKHRFDNCEVLYYVVSGDGIASAGGKTSLVRSGHAHFIPKGVEHFIVNTSKTDTLEIVGVYTGAGSIEDGGYVYTGKVSDAELNLA